MKTALTLFMLLAWTASAAAVEPVQVIRDARITGGLIAQIGSENLSLRELGERFHVRLLLGDSAAAARAQTAIDEAGVTGRFTAEVWTGGRLPFAERVLNALVVANDALVSDEEARRVLAPRGLLITPKGATAMPVPHTMDEWSHYLYDASGNAVSKDREVAPPRSLRWWAEPFEPIELESRALVTMPGGWKMSQLQAEQPSTTYAEFKREILNEIARCLNMPFNIAAGNSSSYNYASGRLDHQTYYKSLRVEQAHMESVVLDRVLAAWLDEAVLIPELWPEDLGPMLEWPHQWFWDGQEHVDPAKEATAQATRLASHTTTLAYEYARQGRDWEDALRQRAKEQALMRELGLTPTQTVPGPASDEKHTDEEDREEEETNAAA
jgi:hypothetical protein